MALVQIPSAFVEKVISGQDGPFALRIAEPHSRRTDGGGFETVARTYRTVKSRVVSLAGFGEGDRVRVVGVERTESREWNGEKRYELVVWADAVALIRAKDGDDGASAAVSGPGSGAESSEGFLAPEAGGDDVPF